MITPTFLAAGVIPVLALEEDREPYLLCPLHSSFIKKWSHLYALSGSPVWKVPASIPTVFCILSNVLASLELFNKAMPLTRFHSADVWRCPSCWPFYFVPRCPPLLAAFALTRDLVSPSPSRHSLLAPCVASFLSSPLPHASREPPQTPAFSSDGPAVPSGTPRQHFSYPPVLFPSCPPQRLSLGALFSPSPPFFQPVLAERTPLSSRKNL